MSPKARTSIVVATRNRRARVLGTLERLRSITDGAGGHPPIIVVDDDSDDGTADLVRERHPEVTVVRAPHNLGAAARNLGVAAAETPYVALADDDSWYAPGALARAADVLDRFPSIGLVAGSIAVEPGGREDPTNRMMATSPLPSVGLPGPEVLGFVACGAVVRRRAYLEVGGFDRRLHIGGEEELLALDLRAAGWRCVYVASVRAHHAPHAEDPRPDRERLLARNRLWVAWMRRSPASLASTVRDAAVRALADPAERTGMWDAVRGLAPLLSERRPVPAAVERDKRLTERAAG